MIIKPQLVLFKTSTSGIYASNATMNVQFINNLSSSSASTDPNESHSHEAGGSLHSHDHGVNEHGHTHEHLDDAGESFYLITSRLS